VAQPSILSPDPLQPAPSCRCANSGPFSLSSHGIMWRFLAACSRLHGASSDRFEQAWEGSIHGQMRAVMSQAWIQGGGLTHLSRHSISLQWSQFRFSLGQSSSERTRRRGPYRASIASTTGNRPTVSSATHPLASSSGCGKSQRYSVGMGRILRCCRPSMRRR
jgi:hypothetical protein